MGHQIVLLVAIVANGLLAGLFFAFASAVTPGFRTIDDTSYAQTFRAVNRAILNGWFLVVFAAAPISAILHLVVRWGEGPPSIVATVFGAAGALLTFLITVGRSVPLNTRLERASLASSADVRLARDAFERRWNAWNLVRTVTSLMAFVGLVTAEVLG